MPDPAVSTTVEELPESRVRVEAQVPVEELRRRLEQTARALGRDMRMPGFRKGKIPAQVVLQRLGQEAVLDEAIRSSIGRWYGQALDSSGVRPVGDPDIDLGDPPAAGEPLSFSFEIGVRPVATLGVYEGLEVARREPRADEEVVEAQLEELRGRMATLEPSEEPAAEGDFVVIDFAGHLVGEEQPFDGGTGADQLVELGSGRLIPGFEDQLLGARAGDERTVSVSFPEDYQAEHLAARDAEFMVTVKEVRRRLLPELNDDFASDAAGFETLDELREDIATRLREADEQRAEGEYREAVLDAAADNASIAVPEALARARARELLERMLHTLEHQGISREMYFQMAGKGEDELLDEGVADADRTLRREAVLEAVGKAEGIEPSDGDVLDALQSTAAREGTTPEKLRARLEKSGRLDDLLDDLRQRAALELLVERAKAIEPEPAAAHEQLQTPDKD
ncbi:MAG: trigger factor [Solirubrobacteraceae bacterium]|nr:trigger factor [Solirubrobacteraceae bacterium]